MKKQREPLKGLIVTIDGPAGAGKSTVSRKLADVLNGMLLDTGGMYRSVAYFALAYDVKSEEGLGALARDLKFDIDSKSKTLLVDGKVLGSKIRSVEVGNMASSISRYRAVRSVLTREQRRLGKKLCKHFPVVVEGRDIGTVVFPKAPFKFFVTATEEERAKRRLRQLRRQGTKGLRLKEIQRENELRDKQDSTRKLAPLRCPEDAVIVDTSSMGITQVVRFMRDHILGRMKL